MLPEFVIDSYPQIEKLAHPKNWAAPFEIVLLWNKQRAASDIVQIFLEN